VHPIITHGGSQVNVIPGEVRTGDLRARANVEAILDANKKVDRRSGPARWPWGQGRDRTLPGYMPMTCDASMARLYRDNAAALVGAEHYREIGHRTGSTDMGDLSMVMPVLHPYMGGATGSGHGADYQIVDQTLAYLGTAKALASMVVDLLADGATGRPRGAEVRAAPDDARAVPVVPARHRATRGLRGVAARSGYPSARVSE
jgi:metal-dependent amidase/aminoacylase/carboxypeptidase family protein